MDDMPMIDPPCGTWFFIWLATALHTVSISAGLEVPSGNELTLSDEESPVKIDPACPLPCFWWHRQEF